MLFRKFIFSSKFLYPFYESSITWMHSDLFSGFFHPETISRSIDFLFTSIIQIINRTGAFAGSAGVPIQAAQTCAGYFSIRSRIAIIQLWQRLGDLQ